MKSSKDRAMVTILTITSMLADDEDFDNIRDDLEHLFHFVQDTPEKKDELVRCKSGFAFTVKVGQNYACLPQKDDCPPYSYVEVQNPTECDDLLVPYEDTARADIYIYVPIWTVHQLIKRHGGRV
jgi:hypothetical protein